MVCLKNIGSTIFAPITEVYSRKGNPSYFYKKENHSLVDCTDEVYIEKLSKIIEEHGVNFNYYDTLSRQLLYFYIDAYKKEKDTDLSTMELNVSSYVYRIIKNNPFEKDLYNNGHYFCYEHLLKFIEHGEFPYELLEEMWDLALYYPENILLLQALNLCLKIEVDEENIPKSTYEHFIKRVTLFLENYYPEEYEQFKEADAFNDSDNGYKLEFVFSKK